MHIWYVLAFIAFCGAALLAGYQRALILAVLAAGLALWLVPAAFQLH